MSGTGKISVVKTSNTLLFVWVYTWLCAPILLCNGDLTFFFNEWSSYLTKVWSTHYGPNPNAMAVQKPYIIRAAWYPIGVAKMYLCCTIRNEVNMILTMLHMHKMIVMSICLFCSLGKSILRECQVTEYFL